MRFKHEFSNGILIFFGIGIYFLIMELLGLSHIYVLRVFNAFIVAFAVNKTIAENVFEHKVGYLQNFISGILTSLIGVVSSIAGLRAYVAFKGGNAYLSHLSNVFIYGNHATLNEYCLGLLFEGAASSIIVVFIVMMYHNSQFAVD